MNTTVAGIDRQTRPKVAVVLGSGGIKSLAGIALFEFLDQARIPVDLLVGCSGGGLLAAMFGAGHTPAQCRALVAQFLNRKLFAQVDRRAILGLVSSRLGQFGRNSGFFKPQALQRVYRQIFGDRRLEDFHPKTVLQATDISTGEGVVLSRGLARDAVYASGAFFPALPPLRMEDRWLGDGVYSAPVPALEAVRRNMDVIIAVDFKEEITAEPQGFLESFGHHIRSSMRSLTCSQMGLAVQMHHHEIIPLTVEFDRSINIRDAHEAAYILEMGERAVAKHTGNILAAVNDFAAVNRGAAAS